MVVVRSGGSSRERRCNAACSLGRTRLATGGKLVGHRGDQANAELAAHLDAALAAADS